MIGEVQWKRREDSINIKKGGCGVTFSPSLVIKGGGRVSKIIFFG